MLKVQTSFITACKVTASDIQVSPPSLNRATTPSTFTEWKTAFIGPYHLPKILRQKAKTTKVILNELPLTVTYNLSIHGYFTAILSNVVNKRKSSMTIFMRPPKTEIGAKRRNFRLRLHTLSTSWTRNNLNKSKI